MGARRGIRPNRFEGFHRSLAPTQRLLVQFVYLSSLAATLRNFEGYFSDDMRRLAEAYGPRVADHMSDMASGPMTLTPANVCPLGGGF